MKGKKVEEISILLEGKISTKMVGLKLHNISRDIELFESENTGSRLKYIRSIIEFIVLNNSFYP